MDGDLILATLRAHRAELASCGVRRAALFGSRARGDDRPDSDIDIAIEIDEAVVPDIFAYAGIKRRIAELFDGPVDVVDIAALKPAVRSHAAPDAVYAF